MLSPIMSTPTTTPRLIGVNPTLEAVFPDESSRPGIRTFNEWMKRGYFPKYKIGRRVFLDPEEVRRALDRRFRINASIAQ
jgi:hypothetical protein